MRSIVLTLFMALIASPVYAADPPPLYQQGDPENRFREAQLHVRELMKAGKYKEASAFMSVYQKLACEAGEQKAGRSREEGAAYCANKHNQAGVSAERAAATTGTAHYRVYIRPIPWPLASP